ncbi:MAG TPA: nuclear transport factor 2 family protein [Dehalococcoidia bacterium]|nr:nuclear transport factor 2 family protein [Dehalococcoidia bacterium]
MSKSAGIRELIPISREWLEGWRTFDFAKLAVLCDFDADFCFQPMHGEHPATGREGLEKYVTGAKGAGVEIRDFEPTDITYGTQGDMLWAWAVCFYKALYPGATKPFTAPVRITFVAKNLGGEWKLQCVHHSTQQQVGQAATGDKRDPHGPGDPEAKKIAKEIAEAFTNGWSALDLDQVKSVWDPDHESLIYQAFEGPQGLRSWHAMGQYADRLRASGVKSGTRFRWPELTDNEINAGRAGDFLWAHCQRDFFVYHPDDPETKLGGHPYRETWLAHRAEDGWKAFHYHESVIASTPLDQQFIADHWPD